MTNTLAKAALLCATLALAAGLSACGSEPDDVAPSEAATETVSPSPSPSPSASETASAGVGPLGIAAGYYVDVGRSCGDPGEMLFYDGKRLAYMIPGMPASDGFPADPGVGPDTVAPIGAVERDGSGFFLPDWEMLVKVLGPERIQLTIQDTGPAMRLCQAGQVPAAMRVR